MKNLFLAITLLMAFAAANAQPPGGGRGPRMDPEEMVEREKEMVLKKVSNLSEDQVMLVEGIYDEFGVTLKETFEEIRKTRNFEQMREKMPALRDEKDLLIKDVLNEDQFTEYMALMENNRKQRRERMQQRNNSDGVSGQ